MANESYKIVAGDTLSAIAKKYNTTIGALADLNQIKDINKIYAGQIIKIPGSSTTTTISKDVDVSKLNQKMPSDTSQLKYESASSVKTTGPRYTGNPFTDAANKAIYTLATGKNSTDQVYYPSTIHPVIAQQKEDATSNKKLYLSDAPGFVDPRTDQNKYLGAIIDEKTGKIDTSLISTPKKTRYLSEAPGFIDPRTDKDKYLGSIINKETGKIDASLISSVSGSGEKDSTTKHEPTSNQYQTVAKDIVAPQADKGVAEKDTTEDVGLQLVDKEPERASTLNPAQRISFYEFTKAAGIKDPMRGNIDWEKMWVENREDIESGKFDWEGAEERYLIKKDVPSSSSPIVTEDTQQGVKYIEGYPSSSDEMEQWQKEGRVFDQEAGKWREAPSSQQVNVEGVRAAIAELLRRKDAGEIEDTKMSQVNNIISTAQAAMSLLAPQQGSNKFIQDALSGAVNATATSAPIINYKAINSLKDFSTDQVLALETSIKNQYGTFQAYADALRAEKQNDSNRVYDDLESWIVREYPAEEEEEAEEVEEKAKEVEDIDNLNELTDPLLSGYSKKELMDAGLTILKRHDSFKEYAKFLKEQVDKNISLGDIARAVYNYYYS